MKRNEICCDICGLTVAEHDGLLFGGFDTKKPYIKVPYNYIGAKFFECGALPVNARKEFHICEFCLECIKKDLSEAKMKRIIKISNETCGECKWFVLNSEGRCLSNEGEENASNDCCSFFEAKVITNGDVIRQGGDYALAHFKSEQRCDVCAYAAPIDTAPACRRPESKSCFDGMLAWLNAPAESQLNDAIQNVIKDGAKNAIDIHEAAYAPDMNDGTKESEGEYE